MAAHPLVMDYTHHNACVMLPGGTHLALDPQAQGYQVECSLRAIDGSMVPLPIQPACSPNSRHYYLNSTVKHLL